MVVKIEPKSRVDETTRLRALFLKAEQDLINEITRKRYQGLVDYAEVASLERVQKILNDLVDESWIYVPKMIDDIFIKTDKDISGYRNARALTITQTAVTEQLVGNLMGEIIEAAETAEKSIRNLYTIARLEADKYRQAALIAVAEQQAEGTGWTMAAAKMSDELRKNGITAFVDKAGRHWTLRDYCSMCARTTARQAEVAAVLTADEGHDLYQIVKIGSTCPVCAPLEGRVYSKSGKDPNYPPLALAFGKIDVNGPDDLSNTYLNIHPNCRHSLIPYTTIGKTEKQIQKDIEFSDPKTNPLTHDPRSKRQIEAYRQKEKNRRKLLDEFKEWKRYKSVLGDGAYKTFATFRKHREADDEIWKKMQAAYKKQLKAVKEAANG